MPDDRHASASCNSKGLNPDGSTIRIPWEKGIWPIFDQSGHIKLAHFCTPMGSPKDPRHTPVSDTSINHTYAGCTTNRDAAVRTHTQAWSVQVCIWLARTVGGLS